MVMFNADQWAGNYNAAGVTRIDASLANLGTTPLYIRLAFLSGSSVYGSTTAVELPPDGVWRRATFDLTGDALTFVEGTETASQALSHVMFLRMVSAHDGPTHIGDFVAGTLGVDDVRALRLPGDANFDGRVDSTDYRIARLNLGARGPHTWAEGDFDFDGRVSALDLLALRRNLGMSIPPAVAARAGAAALAVPEPAAALLLLLVSPVVLLRRRRAGANSLK
jgi:hypothetical protein